MPNWCDTVVAIYGNSENVLSMYDTIKTLCNNESRVENGFGNSWEGNVLDAYGIDWHTIHCRGEITDYRIEYEDGEKEYSDEERDLLWGRFVLFLAKAAEEIKENKNAKCTHFPNNQHQKSKKNFGFAAT